MKKYLPILFTSIILYSCSSPNIANIDNETSSILSKEKNYIPIGTSMSEWGGVAQIAATYQELLDIKGNKDGIWENEDKASGTVTGIGTTLPFKPWFERKEQSLKAILTSKNVISEISNFVDSQEKLWGRKTSNIGSSEIQEYKLFNAQKAIYLSRMNRNPKDVTEGFIKASGTVNDISIDDRNIFWQRFKPLSSPNGKVVLISPGFQETGRNFYEQINKLNKEGYDVITMDHQWAGYTKGGQAGGLDRGFGASRDVAVMASFASEISDKDYSSYKNHEAILFGNSMGAGPGVLGAITLNDNGKIKLNGKQMPIGMKALLQSPYLATTESVINSAITVFSKVPFAKSLQLYSSGLPILTHDKVAAQKGTQVALLEDIRAQLKTMSSGAKDINYILDMIKSGEKPKGSIVIVHGKNDPLASSEKSSWLNTQMQGRARVQIINSDNHVFEQSPTEQNYAISAIKGLL